MNQEIVSFIQQAQSVLIVISKQAKRDSFAAGLGLYINLAQEGKTVRICSESDLSHAQGLRGADKIKQNLNLGGNVLKVSFPYKDGAIDKVTYNITDDRFNLLIEPRSGEVPLQFDDVQYSYTGGNVDAIITIDAPMLESIGNIYLENPDIFIQGKIVNIGRRFDNKKYGVHNIIDKQRSSTSELILDLIQSLRVNMLQDTATNLYAGIVAATNNFTSFSTNAQTFNAVALLLKSGAKKTVIAPKTVGTGFMPANQRFIQPVVKSPLRQGSQNDAGTNQGYATGMAPQAQMQANQPKPFTIQKPANQASAAAMPQPRGTGFEPYGLNQQTVQKQGPQKQAIPQRKIDSNNSVLNNSTPPTDWLKPKIFKSSDKLGNT